MFASFFIDFLFMKNNKQWFESPKQENFRLINSLVQQQQQQDSLNNNPNLNSPSSFPHHRLSPFAFFQNSKPDQALEKAFTLNTEGKDKEIKDIISFSEVQDQSDIILTPAQNSQKRIQDQLSTARKQGLWRNPNTRKTRPKEKGLKGLSTKAYSIMKQMKQGTYKEVAVKLLKEFGLNPNSEKQTNQEMNIKRRVYDALNVLIALGLLKKEGKKIVCQQIINPKRKREREEHQKNWLSQNIRMKNLMILEKQQKLSEVQQKYKGIKKLLEHNISCNSEIKLVNEFIPFPFIGLNVNDWKVEGLQDQKIQIRFKNFVRPFGDIDSLRWL